MQTKNIVAIGGGTGLSVLLRGIKSLPVNIAAIVTMADNGKSSGRLRRAYGGLPPGDIRQCLVALSKDEELLTKLFNFRFSSGRGLSGHNFGNLFILALTEITGNFEQAVRESSRILATRGKVIPSTLAIVNLAAELQNKNVVLGESDIPVLGHRSPISRVFLVPENVPGNPEALQAINDAELILIGPGSLYTSIIPNLLFKDLVKAITKNKKAKKIFISNVSTERGETEKYSVTEHIDAILKHTNAPVINTCLVNEKILISNGDEGKFGSIHNITTDVVTYKNILIIKENLIDESKPLFHDYKKLGRAIEKLL